jgi:hypothetical protein
MKATMFRLGFPEGATPAWQARDSFAVEGK